MVLFFYFGYGQQAVWIYGVLECLFYVEALRGALVIGCCSWMMVNLGVNCGEAAFLK